jgi:hypothetical protein
MAWHAQFPVTPEEFSISSQCPIMPPMPYHFSAVAKALMTFPAILGLPSENHQELLRLYDATTFWSVIDINPDSSMAFMSFCQLLQGEYKAS